MSSSAPPPAAASPSLPDTKSEWCLEEWRSLDEGTCYVVPDGGATRLMIYLAGIIPPTPRSTQKENVQRVVMAAAKRARVAVLLPRGRRNIGPKDARDWWAWPTGPQDHATYANELVAEWRAARAKLETAQGHPFERVYLAGSSSGAYFLTTLAFAAQFEADGYAAASGGAPGAGAKPEAHRHPFYVGYATGDPTNGGPKALAAYLKSAGWPVKVGEHPGGHGAKEVYLDEALAFWAGLEDAGR